MNDLDQILTSAPVIPVLTIARAQDAVPIGRALVAGGLRVLEVTLRTPAALDSIRAMRRIDGAIVGAGTVLDPERMAKAVEAGAEFLVSPGLTERLGAAARNAPVPLLPGVASASDIMRALEFGFTRLKFFPAAQSGGIGALKGLSAIFPNVRFCPTGGIGQDDAGEWLAQPSVLCVGGSWLVPASEPVDPAAIEARARKAASLRRPG
ncbi:MAG TPA: bifunctional 4-hydroxy-2-oxoglutarate aldolase/2-dehydro-3-deoxy-phosphogluconate aldolase [Sphingomicrobium sp.]|nr:bifunctional 4-hydroxy-2-oxoglutarate aldolase/2-dehydro-3-deoxy-phosphogluconate aldolase [Sphingomicrobium sp.]